MNKKHISVLSSALIVIGLMFFLCAWSPWVSEAYADQRVTKAFAEAWENSNDGCEIVDLEKNRKVIFGRKVTIHYRCGWEGDVITKGTKEVFVPFTGIVNYKYRK